MTYELTRRGFLAGTAAAGVTILGQPLANVVHAADGRVVVRVEEDLKNLDPANRSGPIDVNVILAVGQGQSNSSQAPRSGRTMRQPISSRSTTKPSSSR